MTDTTTIAETPLTGVPGAFGITLEGDRSVTGVISGGSSAGTAGKITLPSAAQKYVTAFILFASVAITPFSTLFVAGFSWTSLWQFIALLAGAVVTYLVPLAPKGWQGIYKTLTMTVAAIATAIIPVWQNDWNAASIFVLATAVITSIGTELGVQFRIDQNVSTTINPA